MATTTTNFGWDIPQSTDLVKDGATAIAALGQDIDTALVDLKGGTTGQVLAKASNTNLDYTWVTQDDANAIQNALLTTTGDTIYASGASTPARLGIGSSGQVLTVSGGVPAWASPAAGPQGLTLISATSCSAVSSQAVTAFSSTYDNYKIIFSGNSSTNNYVYMKMRSGSTDSSTEYRFNHQRFFSDSAAPQNANTANGSAGFEITQTDATNSASFDLILPFSAVRTGILSMGTTFQTSNTRSLSTLTMGIHNVQTSYDGFNLIWTTGSFTGTIFVYGYKKS